MNEYDIKIDTQKIGEIIKAEINEMRFGAHEGSIVAIGSIEVKKGVFAQVQISITIDGNEIIDEPCFALKCL